MLNDAMDWTVALVVGLVFFALLRRHRKRRHEDAAQLASVGIARSPLHLGKITLILLLLGLMFSAVHLPHGDATVAYGWLVTLGAVLVGLFFVQRAINRRYPL